MRVVHGDYIWLPIKQAYHLVKCDNYTYRFSKLTGSYAVIKQIDRCYVTYTDRTIMDITMYPSHYRPGIFWLVVFVDYMTAITEYELLIFQWSLLFWILLCLPSDTVLFFFKLLKKTQVSILLAYLMVSEFIIIQKLFDSPLSFEIDRKPHTLCIT